MAWWLTVFSAFCAAANAQPWPNEPAGFTTVLDCPFTNSLCSGMWDGNALSGFAPAMFANVGTTPLSQPWVLDSYLVPGANGGGNWVGVEFPTSQEVYVGALWSTNAGFTGMVNNDNKMIFANGTGNAYISWHGQPSPANRNLVWHQTDCDNSHLGQANAYEAGWIEPNLASSVVAPGSGWHRIEMYQKASTTCSSQDGILRIWLDGVMTHDFTNVNGNPGGFRDVQINHAWDGAMGCSFGNRIPCTNEWHHYFDHLYVSAGSGGARPPPPPPPPPPTPPPPPVTGTPGSVIDLAVSQIGSDHATLSFSQVSDGAGSPAKYDMRYSAAGALWGGGSSVSQGTCSTPLQGTAASGNLTCTVLGLSPSTRYEFQLVAYRGTMNQGAAYGGLSNVASATTSAGLPVVSCDANNDGATNVVDVQLGVNQALGAAACTADINQDDACNVTDVQRLVNAAFGGSCVTGP